jgi:hypothetical protein
MTPENALAATLRLAFLARGFARAVHGIILFDDEPELIEKPDRNAVERLAKLAKAIEETMRRDTGALNLLLDAERDALAEAARLSEPEPLLEDVLRSWNEIDQDIDEKTTAIARRIVATIEKRIPEKVRNRLFDAVEKRLFGPNVLLRDSPDFGPEALFGPRTDGRDSALEEFGLESLGPNAKLAIDELAKAAGLSSHQKIDLLRETPE